MTLKVVRINSETPSVADTSREVRKPEQAQPRPDQPSLQNSNASGSEAVQNLVRVSKSSTSEQAKIKDIRTARETAGDVARNVREREKEADESHSSLEKVSAREHLTH